MKRSRSPPHLVPVRLVRSIHLSYAHYIISAYDLCLGVIPLLFSIEAGAAFITSAPAVNLREQTAVYCSGGDRARISNRLIPPRDNTTNITVIHQKKCLKSRVFAPLSIFHQTFGGKKSIAPCEAEGAQVSEWMVLMVIHAVTCCWKMEF